ncbi:class I SAM-dependent methyltransferase [Marinobacter sp. CHS3-4]|uniref:class I SAM-dependent methyltransferase n=1 Tax=Marinobacter sp. CHS3-4 TaxID=3045174 RepID=UPI0024B59AB4|nr:class I SAM-dependent methyltransferase [Marinobacter sp. CHS3-4]MDI9244995.1 class I SAM-dependent methyltransferase [Marinobacter sp. CHS3-4]
MNEKIGKYNRRNSCRGCHSASLTSFIDFGLMPLAGNFVTKEHLETVSRYPMDLAFCENCSLVQIPNVVSPEVLFSDYRYLSSVTNTLQNHFFDFANTLFERFDLNSERLIVEFGCNDGVLLKPLQDMGVRVQGVDAAPNVVALAEERGIPIINGYFGSRIAKDILSSSGPANIITSSNVFAHIDDLDEVMNGVEILLASDGVLSVEVHYVGELLKGFQFDTVYHEHLCYYSLHSLDVLYKRHGFSMFDVEFLPMHGGTIRVFAERELSGSRIKSDRLCEALRREVEEGITDLGRYERFGVDVKNYCSELKEFILKRVGDGRSLSAFGAAGRSTILLNYCGFDSGVVKYIVDESPFRQGRYVPGVGIPIVSPQVLKDEPTDDCLITAWNYRDEIVSKSQYYLENDGVFLIPLPEIEVLKR